MTEDQLKMICALRDEGYAVCIFTPEEMPNSNPEDVEEAMCMSGWDQINFDTPDGQPISA
jgi:hypothetical protein